MVKYPKKFAPKGTNFLENSNFAWVGNLFGEGGEDFQRQWCNSFTTELVQKLAKTPKANAIL